MRFLLLLLFFQGNLLAQVGIGTTHPTAALDVNGTLRVRSIANETDIDVINDSILVISKTGNVNRVESTDVINAALPTMVRASFSGGGSTVALSLSSGVGIVTFDNELIDSNNEFDTSTNTFTAKQDGIYQVCSQIKYSSALAIGIDSGLGIYKNGVLVAENTLTNIGVLAINVTSPLRYVSTVIDLLEGDTITFKASAGALASVNIFNSSTESYCAIYQIR